MGKIVRQMFIVILVFFTPVGIAYPGAEKDNFAQKTKEYNEQFERIKKELGNIADNASLGLILDKIEKMNKVHFKAWQEQTRQKQLDHAGMELSFSEKYKLLYQKVFNQLIDSGVKLFEGNQQIEAVKIFKDVFRKKPGHELAAEYIWKFHFSRAESLLRAKKIKQAKNETDAAKTYKKYCQKCNTIDAEYAKAQYEKANLLYRKVLKAHEKAPSKNCTTISARKKAKEVLYLFDWIGYVYPDYDVKDKAVLCRSIVRKPTDCSRPSCFEEFYTQAVILFKKGNKAGASAKLNAALHCENGSTKIRKKTQKIYNDFISLINRNSYSKAKNKVRLLDFLDKKNEFNTDTYKRVIDDILSAQRAFKTQKFKDARKKFTSVLGKKVLTNESCKTFLNNSIKECNEEMANAQNASARKKFEEAVILYKGFLSSTCSYAEFKKAENALKKAEAHEPQKCKEYLKLLRRRYLEFHYEKGVAIYEKITKTQNSEAANKLKKKSKIAFEQVRKIDPGYKQTQVYLDFLK